jgi:pectinesterase
MLLPSLRPALLLLLAVASAFAQTTPPTPEPHDPSAIRVVLVGDSTVQSKSGWGDALAPFFKPGLECINRGRGGRSSKSYRAEGHWDAVLELKPDYVLIQFGHNDEPGKGPLRETDPNTTFTENMARYVDEARAGGAQPILITSLTRRNFDAQGKIVSTLTPYVEAVKRVAAAKHAPLLDLNARSTEQAEKLGPAGCAEMNAESKDPAKPDHTHLSAKGAEMVAPLVVEEIRRAAPDLARYLREK